MLMGEHCEMVSREEILTAEKVKGRWMEQVQGKEKVLCSSSARD